MDDGWNLKIAKGDSFQAIVFDLQAKISLVDSDREDHSGKTCGRDQESYMMDVL